MRRRTLLLRAALPAALLAVSGCAPRPAALPGAPAFDPIAFFSGRTHGEGRLRVVLHRARRVRVDGVGTPGADGALVLEQRVAIEGRPTERRTWRLRRTGGGYAATLTDAVGPVTVAVAGSLLHIRYRMKGGLDAEQWLAIVPGGRAADNRLVVRKLGMPVARLDERITRED